MSPEKPQKRRVLRMVLAGLSVILLACGGGLYWLLPRGVTGGTSYASEIAKWPRDLVKDFPPTIPKGATGVRMYTDDTRLMASPSHFIQIRFIAQPADVRAAIAAGEAARAKLIVAGESGSSPTPAGLEVIGDGDPTKPLPVGFQCFPLVIQPENFASVAANPDTGEVVYWATIH